MEKSKKNIGYNLWKYFGVLKGDKEYKKLKKEIKKGWIKWDKRYSKNN